MALIPKNYARLESGYREKALKIYPWVCGRCSREFVYSNLRELTVHHIDHDHTNNPEDGSNTFNPFADLKAMMDKKK